MSVRADCIKIFGVHVALWNNRLTANQILNFLIRGQVGGMTGRGWGLWMLCMEADWQIDMRLCKKHGCNHSRVNENSVLVVSVGKNDLDVKESQTHCRQISLDSTSRDRLVVNKCSEWTKQLLYFSLVQGSFKAWTVLFGCSVFCIIKVKLSKLIFRLWRLNSFTA